MDDDLQIDDISGYVTCVHSSKWWLACVLEIVMRDHDTTLCYSLY